MTIFKAGSKGIAWVVIVSFLYLIQIGSMPIKAENPQSQNQAEGPNALEKEAPSAPEVESRSSFPWILIGLGLVAVGVAVYFLVIKKAKYTLTVTVGAGVKGNPAAGTYEYQKGDTVEYNYTYKLGYRAVEVKLDGTAVAAVGTIIMDKDHTLDAGSVEGLEEEFESSADSLWRPKTPSFWKVSGGYYIAAGAFQFFHFECNYYNRAWSTANYSVTVRLKKVLLPGDQGIFLATSSDPTRASGYFFIFYNKTGDTRYGISKWTNCNWNNPFGQGDPGSEWSRTTIKNHTNHPNVSPLNTWGRVQIVKTGSTYTVASNNVILHSFTDSTHDPRYIALVFMGGGVWDEIDYDYVYVDVGSSTGSVTEIAEMKPNPLNPEYFSIAKTETLN